MQSLETKPFLLDIHSITLRITHEEFEKLCLDNPDLRLELTEEGELSVIAPAGRNLSIRTGRRNITISYFIERGRCFTWIHTRSKLDFLMMVAPQSVYI
jgi:Uma2 family endonuclease